MASQAGSLKADKAWKDHIKKLEDLKNYKPTIPTTFQASLRDYQIEGFEWMSRLSMWGVGACLADDMGLGKTIQALAILLQYAKSGPSLVITPTSVCMNWHSESSKFAPTLNPIQFGSGDRKQMLKNLQPFDLLVCSYGMIQQRPKHSRRW
jgi:SNF2 family DNA or RNA helicase